MLQRIMKHEWRQLTADSTAWLIICLFAVATLCGLYTGTRWVRFQQQPLQKLSNEEQTRLGGLLAQVRETEFKLVSANGATPQAGPAAEWGPTQPYYMGSYKGPRYAYLPPTGMAATAVGQSDLYPYYFKVSTDLKQNFANAYEIENPLKLLVGRFDLAFVLLYLYPLLILALSFNMIAGERENGTLGMLLSQPVDLRTIVLGKTSVRALIAFLSVLVFSTLGFLMTGTGLTGPDALARYFLWVLAVVAYGAFWFSLAVMVNARGRSAATNAMILAAFWLVFVVLLPSAINVVATTAYPVPSRVEYIQAMREASEGEVAARSKLMAAFYEDHPELASSNKMARREEFAITKEMLNKRMEEQLRPLMNRFDEQLAKQQAFVDGFRFLSPAILMQGALYDIAGTGRERYKHFMLNVDGFHREWKDFFNPRIARRELISHRDFDRFPRYTYREEAISDVIRRVSTPLLSIFVPALLIGFLSLRAYRNYRVLR